MHKLSRMAMLLPLVAGCRAGNLLDPTFASRVSKIPATEAAKSLASTSGQRLCMGVNGLGFSLIRSLSQTLPQQNLCISPASISLAVGMTRNGATGDTEASISNALGVPGMSKSDFVDGCSNLAALFENADPKLDVEIANSIWIAPGPELKLGFLATSHQYYDASVSTVDLSSNSGLNAVNDWVKTKTKGKIPSILSSAQAGAPMVLVDAVYFKGLWDTPFDAKATDQEDFHLATGLTKQVPMMRQTSDFAYAQYGSSQVLSIPYKSQRLAMLIYLPDKDTPLSDVVYSMNARSWSQGVAGLSSNTVSVHLPKFSANFSASLKGPLSSCGMTQAFLPSANFSGISNGPLFIGDVLHKTTTDVDEQGTVATAATAVTMGETSAGPGAEPPKPIDFIVDHPFLYAIYDTSTKVILFVGLMVDP